MAQGVHWKEGRHLDCIPKIIGKRPPGHGGAGGGFYTNYIYILAMDFIPHKGKTVSREIAASTSTPNNHVRIVAGNGHLLLGFKAINGLV